LEGYLFGRLLEHLCWDIKNGFDPTFLAQFAAAGKKAGTQPKPNSCCFDLLDSLIALGGLLGLVVVVSQLFGIPILVLWVGLEISIY
jgi:hypothetical protein